MNTAIVVTLGIFALMHGWKTVDHVRDRSIGPAMLRPFITGWIAFAAYWLWSTAP